MHRLDCGHWYDDRTRGMHMCVQSDIERKYIHFGLEELFISVNLNFQLCRQLMINIIIN